MQKNAQALMEKIGIKELFEISYGKLQGNTVLAKNGKDNITVSQLLKSAEYLIKFIKDNFDVVMHEIADIRAKNDSEKKLNEEIAVSLNYLVEILK